MIQTTKCHTYRLVCRIFHHLRKKFFTKPLYKIIPNQCWVTEGIHAKVHKLEERKYLVIHKQPTWHSLSIIRSIRWSLVLLDRVVDFPQIVSNRSRHSQIKFHWFIAIWFCVFDPNILIRHAMVRWTDQIPLTMTLKSNWFDSLITFHNIWLLQYPRTLLPFTEAM